jgi:hypothetical protein
MGQRRKPDGDIVEHLGENTAEPDHDERTERLVASRSDDQLDAGFGHRLDEEAARVDAAAARECDQFFGRSADRVVAADVETDEPEVALVSQARGVDLDDDGVSTQRSCRLHGSVCIAHGDRGRHGEPGMP